MLLPMSASAATCHESCLEVMMIPANSNRSLIDNWTTPAPAIETAAVSAATAAAAPAPAPAIVTAAVSAATATAPAPAPAPAPAIVTAAVSAATATAAAAAAAHCWSHPAIVFELLRPWALIVIICYRAAGIMMCVLQFLLLCRYYVLRHSLHPLKDVGLLCFRGESAATWTAH